MLICTGSVVSLFVALPILECSFHLTQRTAHGPPATAEPLAAYAALHFLVCLHNIQSSLHYRKQMMTNVLHGVQMRKMRLSCSFGEWRGRQKRQIAQFPLLLQ